MSALHLSALSPLCLLALLSCFSGGAAWAQNTAVSLGSRVRVQTGFSDKGQPRGPRATGQLTAWTADSLVLDPAGEQARWAVLITEVSRLEVSRGRESKRESVLRWGALGFVLGLTTGALLNYDETSFFSPVLTAIATGAPVGVAGALVGAVIGANRRSERWEQVEMPVRWRRR